MTHLQSVLDGTEHPPPPSDKHTAAIYYAQEKLDWDQLLKGRFAYLWTTNSVLPSQQQKHTSWTVEVIDCIFEQWWKLWDIRNQDRHGRDRLTQAQASTTQAQRELKLIYDRFKAIAPQTLQWLFNMDIDTRQQWTTPKLRQWINTWQPVLEDRTRPPWAPTNSENYPFQTALETG